MNFLCINPWIHDFAAFDLWIRPLGFLYLYSFLRKKGCSLTYIDCLHVSNKEKEIYNIDVPKPKKYGAGKFYSEKIEKPEAYSHITRDYRRYGKPPEVFRGQLASIDDPDIILLTSSMTYWYRGVQETIEICKEVFPKTKYTRQYPDGNSQFNRNRFRREEWL